MYHKFVSFFGTQTWLNDLDMLPFKGTMMGVLATVLANSTWDIILKIRRFLSLLGVLTKLRKATISFVMSSVCLSVCPSVSLSVRPSVCIEQLDSNWTDVHEIWYLSIFRNSVEKIKVSLKSANNYGYLTSRHLVIYDKFSLNFS